MKNIFEKFDDKIGDDGYINILKDELFKSHNSTSSGKIAAFPLEVKTYRKGAVFSRVRPLESPSEIDNNITPDEFYPPHPSKKDISQGRFNASKVRTLYLSDHPLISMKECGIKENQYFLLGNIELSVDMHFLYVKESKNKFTNMLNQLIHSKDSKFYSVINRIAETVLGFPEYQGIVYRSVKIENSYQGHVWQELTTTFNIAIYNNHIKNTDLVAGWLCSTDKDLRIYEHSLFRPLSNKKKKKLSRLNYHPNNKKFIKETSLTKENLIAKSKHMERLLNKGDYSKINPVAIKIYKD